MARNKRISPGIMVQIVSIRCASEANRHVYEFRIIETRA